MKPHLAALAAGPAALPGWLLGAFLGGLAHWGVALLAPGLAGAVQAAVQLLVPPALALAVYAFVVHGPDRPLFAGMAGVGLGALAGSAALALGLLGWAPALLLLALGGGLLGAAAALAAGGGAGPPQP